MPDNVRNLVTRPYLKVCRKEVDRQRYAEEYSRAATGRKTMSATKAVPKHRLRSLEATLDIGTVYM
jgi:hypothetical protein